MLTNYTVVFSKTFLRKIKKLTEAEQDLIMAKVDLLEENPFYRSLRSKKLNGYPELYESRANKNIRIIWQFEDDSVILLLDVGHHDILKIY